MRTPGITVPSRESCRSPGFTAAHLIDELHGEEKRDRRRLLLSLLEIHGASSGVTARAIEAEVVADSFRIRRLLARWVEDGSLKPA